MKSNHYFSFVFIVGFIFTSVGHATPSARQTEYLEKMAKECKSNQAAQEELDSRKNLIWDEALQIQNKADAAIGAEVVKIFGIETFIRSYRIEIASKELQVYEESLTSIADENFLKLSRFLRRKHTYVESLLYSKGARKNAWLGGACGIGSYDLGTTLKFPDAPSSIRTELLSVLGLTDVKTAKSIECLKAINSAIEMLEPSAPLSIRQRLMQAKTNRTTARLNQTWSETWVGSFASSTSEKCRAPIACSDSSIVEKLKAASETQKSNLVLAGTLRLAFDNLDGQVRALDSKLSSKRDDVRRFFKDTIKLTEPKHACLENE